MYKPFLVGLLLFQSIPMVAQTTLGTITGRVLDATGGALTAAAVKAENTATRIVYRTETNASGNYVLAQLPVGTYELAIQATGFKRYVHKNIGLNVAQTVTLDATLEVGQIEQSVEVTADVGLLQTSTSDLGTTIDRNKLVDLPMFVGGAVRNLEQFIFLAPGVSGDSTNTQISGSPSRAKEILVDGIASTGIESGGVIPGAARPSVETIGEFKLLRANFNAEYGRTGGGLEIFTTRSGTNQYHGAAFDFLRNNVFDARGFFQPIVPVNRQNEFGASLGGPMIVPRVYNGRNKTFFFFVYGGYRFRQGPPNTLTSLVPNDFRNGDFTNAGAVIYDPATTQFTGSGVTRQPFPDNKIPSSRFSTVSKNVLAQIPVPVNNSLFNNFISQGRGYVNENQYNIKLDHSFTERNRFSGYYYQDAQEQLDPTGGGADKSAVPGPAAQGAVNTSRNHWARLSHDYVFSPSVLNHIGFGYTRFRTTIDSLSLNQDWPQKLGLTGVNTGANNSFPCLDFSAGSYTSLGHPNCNSRTLQTNNAFQFDESLSVVRGSHNLKFGYEYRFMETNGIDNFRAAGTFAFNALETGLPGTARTGNIWASFLLGAVDRGLYKVFAYYPRNRYQYTAGYAQDDWKVSQKLTLNIGLRYDLFFPRYEKLDNLSTFDSSVPNPAAGGRLGALVFLGNGPGRNGRRAFSDTYHKNFGPRVGLAYQLLEKTAIRAGYGIYYSAGNGVAGLRDSLSQTYGYSANPVFQTTDQGATPAFYWDKGFPQNFPRPPFIDPSAANGQDIRMIARQDGVAPQFQNWTIMIQQALTPRVSLEGGYVGTKGSRVGNGLVHYNQLNPQDLSLGSLLSQPFNSPVAVAAGITQPYPGFTGSVAQALRPYPQYLDLWDRADPSGSSTYHALQSQLVIRAFKGLDVQASYTFAKTLSDTDVLAGGGPSGQNSYNRRLEKAVATTDVPYIFAIGYSYELPFGAGKAFLHNHGIGARILGGWVFTGIQQYNAGVPVVLTANNTLPLFNLVLRPDAVSGVGRQLGGGGFDPATQPWINPAAFKVPAAFRFGTSARSYGDLRNPSFFNENFGLMKKLRIHERIVMTLRGEFFNSLNRVVFGTPAANVSNGNFGRITSQANQPRQGQVALRLEF